MENKNWKHANQIVAGAWDVEHVHELNKLPTPRTYIFSSFEVGKENDKGRKCNLTCRRCTRCCNVAQIWHPSPYNYIFRSFEVGSEKGRTEEIEFDNLCHHPQFHFPEPWSGTWKIKTENMQIRLSQVHEMLNMCMNWTNYQHPTPTFSRVLRWEKENDRGRKCNLTCRRCTRCCNFAQIWHPSPYNYIFRSFEVGIEKGRTEEIEFDNLYHHTQFHFPEPWKWDMEHKNWKHANQIAAGAWDVEHEHELNKLPTPHTYIFSSFEVGKENDRGSTCNLTCRTCTRGCNFARIWHPSPYNYIFRSFEVGNEKGTTEEIEFDNVYHHPQFHFPEPWSGTWKIKTENMQIRLPQVHEMLNMCMEQTTNTPHLHFLEFWGGKKKTTEAENVIWLAAGARDVVILHKYDTPAPTITFSGVLK